MEMQRKKSNKLLTEFQDDVDIIKKYAYNFNFFISPRSCAYCQLRIFYDDATNGTEISYIISGSKKSMI